jgi:hypothetical protein
VHQGLLIEFDYATKKVVVMNTPEPPLDIPMARRALEVFWAEGMKERIATILEDGAWGGIVFDTVIWLCMARAHEARRVTGYELEMRFAKRKPDSWKAMTIARP